MGGSNCACRGDPMWSMSLNFWSAGTFGGCPTLCCEQPRGLRLTSSKGWVRRQVGSYMKREGGPPFDVPRPQKRRPQPVKGWGTRLLAERKLSDIDPMWSPSTAAGRPQRATTRGRPYMQRAWGCSLLRVTGVHPCSPAFIRGEFLSWPGSAKSVAACERRYRIVNSWLW
jgi:hypothetical protein